MVIVGVTGLAEEGSQCTSTKVGGHAGCQVGLQALKKRTQIDLMARETRPVLREALVSIPLSLSL